MSSLKDRITDDMKQALRAGDKPRLSTLRMALAAIKQREIDERIELDDAAVTASLEKMVKQRRESVEQYQKGDRADLADIETAEITVLQGYLPKPMSAEQLHKLVDAVIEQTGASGMQQMGQVMGLVKKQAAGRADMSQVSALVKARLSG